MFFFFGIWNLYPSLPPDGSPPPSKRRSLSSGPQQQSGPLRASPIKSKQFSFGQVKDRRPKDKPSDTPVVQLHWPVSWLKIFDTYVKKWLIHVYCTKLNLYSRTYSANWLWSWCYSITPTLSLFLFLSSLPPLLLSLRLKLTWLVSRSTPTLPSLAPPICHAPCVGSAAVVVLWSWCAVVSVVIPSTGSVPECGSHLCRLSPVLSVSHAPYVA